MNGDGFHRAYRMALGLALLYVLWQLVPAVGRYTSLVVSTTRESQRVIAAQRPKFSAANLEAALRREPVFGPTSQIHCEPAPRDWDYVCSYLPTPLQSPTQLQFGVRVDTERWVKVSSVVPMGTILPSSR